MDWLMRLFGRKPTETERETDQLAMPNIQNLQPYQQGALDQLDQLPQMGFNHFENPSGMTILPSIQNAQGVLGRLNPYAHVHLQQHTSPVITPHVVHDVISDTHQVQIEINMFMNTGSTVLILGPRGEKCHLSYSASSGWSACIPESEEPEPESEEPEKTLDPKTEIKKAYDQRKRELGELADDQTE